MNRKGDNNPARKAIMKLPANHPRRLVRNARYMAELYHGRNMSTTDIAKHLGISNTTVNTGLKQCGIQLRTISDGLKGRPRPGSQGSNHRDWKGGLSGWRKLARGRLNESFVRPVMERDQFTCQWCSCKRDLVVHHIRSFMQIVELVRLYANEDDVTSFVNAIVDEHSLDDGITLCKACHDDYHKKYGK